MESGFHRNSVFVEMKNSPFLFCIALYITASKLKIKRLKLNIKTYKCIFAVQRLPQIHCSINFAGYLLSDKNIAMNVN